MNILVLNPSGLGDVLMTTPLVATLRAAYPDARIDYAVGDWARPAMVTNPDIDEVLPLFESGASLFRRLGQAIRAAFGLRWRRYDLAFVPDRSGLAALVAYLAGVPRRFGLAGHGRAALLTDTVRADARHHDVDVYLSLAEAAGLGDTHHIRHEVRAHAGLAGEGGPALPQPGIRRSTLPSRDVPGRGITTGPTFFHRRWPAQRYAILANQLIAQHGGGVILLGDAGDRELNFLVRNDIDHPVLDLTGRTDVDSMGAVMQLCDAVISNDSGPMHLAVAVGTPTVGIFGPTAARNSGPYGARHRAVQSHIYCGPCARSGGPMDGCGAACIQRITVRDLVTVLEAQAG